MGIFKHPPLPASKKDKTIPYTYEARVDLLRGKGSTPMEESYFADTLCGLIAVLIEAGFAPAEVQLFGVYQQQQTPLDAEPCLDGDGGWLQPPQLCHRLEEHFRTTRDERYRGHVEHAACAYDDRNREGHGPY